MARQQTSLLHMLTPQQEGSDSQRLTLTVRAGGLELWCVDR